MHLDLDYSRLLESFGISENGSDIEKNQESMEPVHRKTKDLETGTSSRPHSICKLHVAHDVALNVEFDIHGWRHLRVKLGEGLCVVRTDLSTEKRDLNL